MSEKQITEEHLAWELTRRGSRYLVDEEGRVVLLRSITTGGEDKHGPYGEIVLENGQKFRVRVKEVV